MTNSDLQPDPDLVARLPLDERGGPAPRISRERAAALVEQALSALPQPAALPSPTPARSWGSWQMLAAAAVVLLALVGGAAAMRFLYGAVDEAPKPKSKPGTTPSAHVLPAAPAAEPKIEPALAPEPAVEPVAAEPERREPRQAQGAPDDLLQKANRLRAQGEFSDAAATYSQVYERYPHSLSAYVAEVAAASIELEHLAHPARARRLFERAIRGQPDGALDLEARQGLSLSLRDLSEPSAEAEALRTLIARHPQSPAAKRAATRLRELAP